MRLQEFQQRADVSLKRRDLALRMKVERRLMTPTSVPLFVGVLTLVGATVGAVLQLRASAESTVNAAAAAQALEKEKFENGLILKALEAPTEEARTLNLKFLIESGLVSDKEHRLKDLKPRQYGDFSAMASRSLFVRVAGTPSQVMRLAGRVADQLRFVINVRPDLQWQISVHVASKGAPVRFATRTGSKPIEPGVSLDEPMSYRDLGLRLDEFHDLTKGEEAKLQSAIESAKTVVAYGQSFGDGSGVQGIHDVHRNPGSDHDGALVVVAPDGTVTTYFFLVADERLD